MYWSVKIVWSLYNINFMVEYKIPAKVKFFNQILHIVWLVNEFVVSYAIVNDIKLDML